MTSHAADLAREEAARSEVEQPDETEQPEQPADVPEPPTALTQAQGEAIVSALDRYKEVVAREVEKRAKVMWQDLIPCPCCMGLGPTPGFIFPNLPEPDQTMRRQLVNQALGGESEPSYPAAKHVVKCEDCDGWGKVASGSRAEGQKAVPCPRCQATGHVPNPEHAPQIQPPAYPAPPPAWVPGQVGPAQNWNPNQGVPNGQPQVPVYPQGV